MTSTEKTTVSSPNEEEEVKPRKGFDPEWVEKNSQPKRWYYPREKRELTPWQKPGPMERRDWVRFYHWASKNAIPRELEEPKEEEPTEEEMKKKKKKKKSLDELLESLVKLCIPKNPREKYEYPEEEDFPYSPKIDRKQPARKDKGRPFEPPEVPECFQHIDIEIDFWSTLRFPVRPSAQNYKASPTILRLAQPRQPYIYNLHCPLPERKRDVVPVRTKMTKRQWVEHMRRLEYLAKPQFHAEFEENMYLDPCACMCN
ncbi:uncharacterized protein LOC119686133 [Teleopsis dalmanni]|uniref:uncharacterized protein LOC119686132 n=1 Tax=Teleopsis dalmanni TaxID=139649 RepID=UPI0018CF484F|nr:uncharacterized protein LOC119686132 [Teleopsis dalmanni]XP_037956535.1 uncharacterized protein LOC119686133 [Teleopsis dalmanni]